MKKNIYSFFLFVFCFLAQFSVVKADSYTGPDGNEYEYMLTIPNNDKNGYGINIYSHYPFAFTSKYPIQGWYRVVTVMEYENQLYLGTLTTNTNTYNSTFNGVYPTQIYNNQIQIEKLDGSKPTRGWDVCFDSSLMDLPVYEEYDEAFEALTYVEPSYYFDASISKPEFDVFALNRPMWSSGPESETNYFSVLFESNNDYKIEIGYKFYVPSFITVGLSNGDVTYNPVQFYSSPYYQAYKGAASNMSYVSNNLNFEWFSYITDDDPIYFNSSVPIWENTWSNQAYSKARQSYIDKYSLCMPLYGNKIQIMARYYVENGSDVYVGPWQVWNSSYPSEFTEQVPSNFQTGSYVSGISGQVNEVSEPEQILTVGEVTGPIGTGTNITVNQVVPNYPDYPTIASYNHDSVLTTFITTASQLPSTFSGFSQFLTSAFGFIPSSIWGVISFGLTCCIVVMIIKIL